ncbi:MAG: VRR-NUC domain-containing protein [Oscillospiraceae bacterium]|nr:VRR-NUC domain-containing protein [Oscillospiraceae bacterium]MDY3065963.1 VRR-NUC domain-containing protein [Oscillospiraceae bacterium]
MRESVIETRLRNGVKAMGGICWKFVSPGTAGVPDRLIILPGGKMIFVELKSDTGRTLDIQKHRITELRNIGADVRVLKGLSQVKAFLEEVQQE